MGGRRLRFTDAERRRLARKAQALGRKVLNELETLVSSSRYHRLVARKGNYSHPEDYSRDGVRSSASFCASATQQFIVVFLESIIRLQDFPGRRLQGLARFSQHC
jgi:hypothetical protein